MMKAVRYTEYGPPEVLQTVQMAVPQPLPNEMLIKVHATSVAAGSLVLRQGKHPIKPWMSFLIRLVFGWKKPRRTILGFEFAGIVESAGNKVTQFKAGDRVYGTTTGLKQGAYAEYVCVPEQWKLGVIRKMPPSLSMQQAAVFPVGTMTSLNLFRRVGNLEGRKVLVIGATGSVGTYAFQMASFLGASKVRGVCVCDKLEAFNAWKPMSGISRKALLEETHFEKYDIIFDASGFWTKQKVKPWLDKKGKFVSVNMVTMESTEVLHEAETMCVQGLVQPLIDKTFSLDELTEAHRYAESGKKFGNIAIQLV